MPSPGRWVRPSIADEERGERLARAGGREDQGVVAGGDRPASPAAGRAWAPRTSAETSRRPGREARDGIVGRRPRSLHRHQMRGDGAGTPPPIRCRDAHRVSRYRRGLADSAAGVLVPAVHLGGSARRAAALVDPGRAPDPGRRRAPTPTAQLRRAGVVPEAVMLTHSHHDHVLGLHELAKLRRLPLYMTKSTERGLRKLFPRLDFRIAYITPGSPIDLGEGLTLPGVRRRARRHPDARAALSAGRLGVVRVHARPRRAARLEARRRRRRRGDRRLEPRARPSAGTCRWRR